MKKDLAKAADKTVNKVTKAAYKTVNEAATGITSAANKAVSAVKKIVDKIYDDPNNIYDTTPKSYEKKIAEVKKTKEWQDIVARKDPEYVKKDEQGNTKYLIDDYLVKKKHPVLDVVDDIANGRKITVNKITAKSTVASIKQTAYSTVAVGAMVATVATKALTEKFKLSQGSYGDQSKALQKQINNGKKFLESASVVTSSVNESNVNDVASILGRGGNITTDLTEEDIEVIKGLIVAAKKRR